LAAIVGGLLGGLLVPLALAAPTSLLLIPAHFLFTLLASIAALGEGLSGRPQRARAWGGAHLLASILMVAGLEVGARVHEVRYWIGPWILALLWGWLPMVVGGAAGATYSRPPTAD
jgi:hypothetical protein